MNKEELKVKLKLVKKSTWIFWGCLSGFIIIGIVCMFVAMHLCGYSLSQWLSQFYPYVIIVCAVILIAILTYVFMKIRGKM